MKIISEEKKNKLHKKNIKKLKWGVVGCGRYLENTFLPTLKLQKKNQLISVFSKDDERAAFIRDKFAARFSYSNYNEFLKSDIDAVYISSINSEHYDQVIKAAEAGKHILCEKPLAITAKQAEDMLKVCKKNNVRLGVNYVYRFHPLAVKSKEIIEKEMLGKIISISADFSINFAPNENFRFKKCESGGGAIRDLGTHMIDLLRYFGGEIEDIKGYVSNVIYKSEVDDFSSGLVKFEKNGFGRFNVSFNARTAFNRIEIIGYKGCLCLEHFIGRKNSSSKLTIDLAGEGKKSFRKKANNLTHLLRSVTNSFLHNEEPLVNGRDGFLNMELMEELEKNSNK
ncbi:MAG: Gfo/Idh/MocA family oxidoreductase [Melioribacteraceae bacterium]|nr:Gfo/Idh/MocA family oxidoreductase [Melioribacteraceae bacterium]